MNSKKCRKCGAVTFADVPDCKRCGYAFDTELSPQTNTGLLAKAKNALAARGIRKEVLGRFEYMLKAAASDGRITDDEMAIIRSFCNENGITWTEYAKVRDKVFDWVVEGYTEKRFVSEAERNAIIHIGKSYGLPEEKLAETNLRLTHFILLNTVATCRFEDLPASRRSGVLLQVGEIDYFTVSSQMIEERVTSTQIVGGSSGFSVEILDGFYYNAGKSRSKVESTVGLVPVSSGQFTVTNQRLVFIGDRQSINARLSDLLNVDYFSNGLRFSLTNRELPVLLQFFTPESTEIVRMYIFRVLNR